MNYSDVFRNLRLMVEDQDCSSCALRQECGADVECWFLQIKNFVKLTCRETGAWIHPTDRLPPAGERVIIARVYEKDAPLRVEQAVYTGNDWWKVFGTNVKTRTVVAWTPMPDPPESPV